MDLDDRIQCQICGRFFASLVTHLTRRHKITVEEYKLQYNVRRVMSEAVRYQLGLNAVERGWGTRAWTDERILQAIRALAAAGQCLAISRVTRDHERIVGVAASRFGSWAEAVKAAGFDYEEVRLKLLWTRQDVREEIELRWREGQPVNFASVHDEDRCLVEAGGRLYGSWDRALEAAGLDPAEIRQTPVGRSWTKDEILNEIDRLRKAGQDLTPMAIKQVAFTLYSAANRHFGGWTQALEKLGLKKEDCYTVPADRWTRERVLEEIRAEHAAGRSLAISDVQSRLPALDNAVNRFFPGAWRTALAEAGLDPDLHLKQEQWSRERVTEELRNLAGQGVVLAWTRMREQFPKLTKAARRWFGSWQAAVLAAGQPLPPDLRKSDLGRRWRR